VYVSGLTQNVRDNYHKLVVNGAHWQYHYIRGGVATERIRPTFVRGRFWNRRKSGWVYGDKDGSVGHEACWLPTLIPKWPHRIRLESQVAVDNSSFMPTRVTRQWPVFASQMHLHTCWCPCQILTWNSHGTLSSLHKRIHYSSNTVAYNFKRRRHRQQINTSDSNIKFSKGNYR